MADDAVIGLLQLGFPWQTFDPFLFCVHHDDAYPAGNAHMGPDPRQLVGRQIGMDFTVKDGWRMYHGDVVPGFPRHPHRGFETVTLARQGFIDHSDSLGATARFGHGDAQWMTAGRGVVHSEMFPLVETEAGNRTELFQIWLNLPRRSKMVPPHFSMLWAETIPKVTMHDDEGRATEVALVAGTLGDIRAPAPPPDSWAADERSHVAIWTIRMDANATWTLPAAVEGLGRTLYAFEGETVDVGGTSVDVPRGVRLRSSVAVTLRNGPAPAQLLMLQGRPLDEPIAHHGPFVMNTPQEIQQAIADYRATGFGGWPWKRDDPVHPRDKGRFAIHADGRPERAPE